jgi:hypothetical protein
VATSERFVIFNCAPSQARGKRRYRGQPGERLARGGAMNHQAAATAQASRITILTLR